MKVIIKKLLFVFRPVFRLLIIFFYEKKYLRSEYFDKDVIGYLWAARSIWSKNILRLEKPMPFPTCLSCNISNPNNIHFHPDDLDNFQSFGTYFQNFKAHIFIGKGSYIAPNVGIITANHQLNNIDEHEEGKDVYLGEKCWIGMNSVILPGVILGNNTIVGAGSVVTKSFPEGNVVIAGVPAKIIKNIVI